MKAHPDWLSRLPNQTSIFDINLPGTHDSAAIGSRWWPFHLWSLQDRSLTEQLNDGVRLLDIRLKVNPSGNAYYFVTCHGKGLKGAEYQTLESALDECRAFLDSNPSEFIAMLLKVEDFNGTDDDKTNVYGALDTLFNNYAVFSSSGSALHRAPDLGSVRGKIYILNRQSPRLATGVPFMWDHNTAGDSNPRPPSTGLRNFAGHVQDQHEGVGSADKLKLFWRTAQNVPANGTTLLLNFASLSRTMFGGSYINRPLLEKLGGMNASQRLSRLGWVPLDYEDRSYKTDLYGSVGLVDLIIGSNFAYQDHPSAFNLDPGEL